MQNVCVHKLHSHCDLSLPFQPLFWCLYLSPLKTGSSAFISSFIDPAVELTPDVFRVISLRTSRLHQAGREASNGKAAAGSDEPCQIHFCVNIANDHHLNKNTRGTRDKKRDTEQYLETKFSSTSQLMFTSVILSFPPIKHMKRLLL